MKNTSKWMAIGKLGRTKGLKGEIYVDLFNPDSNAFDTVEEFQVGEPSTDAKVLKIEEVHESGTRYVLKFQGLDSVDAVSGLVGKELFVDRDVLPKLGKNEFYVSDLVGIDVVGTNGEKVGTLTSVMPTPSNDVYVIAAGTRELLLPAIPSVIQKIDMENRKMIVVVPESENAF